VEKWAGQFGYVSPCGRGWMAWCGFKKKGTCRVVSRLAGQWKGRRGKKGGIRKKGVERKEGKKKGGKGRLAGANDWGCGWKCGLGGGKFVCAFKGREQRRRLAKGIVRDMRRLNHSSRRIGKDSQTNRHTAPPRIAGKRGSRFHSPLVRHEKNRKGTSAVGETPFSTGARSGSAKNEVKAGASHTASVSYRSKKQESNEIFTDSADDHRDVRR